MNDMDKYYNYAIQQMERAAREKKKYNGYKDKADRICFYTDAPCADRHEVYSGTANRQISFYYGFQVDLHPKKHAELHSDTTAWAQDENQKWRETYQRAYLDRQMAEWGMGEDDALRAWMLLIGKNYLKECEPK